MPDGFKIADAFVEIHADDSRVNDDVNRSLRNVKPDAESERLGNRMGSGIGRGMIASLGGAGGGGVVGTTLGVMATKMAVATVAGAGLVAIGAELSGVLGLLPAAGVAGGLAFGALKVGMTGFGDAMKNMGDPAKFGESIAGLAPQAREAAVAIRDLVPAWKDLTGSVQNQLFAETGLRITALAQQYLPMLGSSMTTVAHGMNQGLHDVIDLLQQTGRAADMQAILNSSAAAVGSLTGMFGPLVSVFLDLAAVGAPILAGLAESARENVVQFAAFISHARETGQLGTWIQTGLQAFRDLWLILSTVTGAVWTLVQALGGPDTLMGTLTLVANALATVANFIRDNIAWIGPLAVAIGSVIAVFKVWTMVTNAVRIAQMLLFTTNPIMLLVGVIVAAVALIIMNWDKVKAFLLALWDGIKTAAVAVWNWITSTIVSAVQSASSGISSAWNATKAFLSGIWSAIRGAASAAWSAVTSVIDSAVSRARSILNWFGQLPGLIGGWFRSAGSAASSAMGSLVSMVAGIPSRIMSALGNLGGMLVNSGRALIDGLGRGISNAFGAVKSKVSGMMSSLRNLFPFSPAKEGPFSGSGYTTHSGAALASDFARGILSQSDSIRSAVGSITRMVQTPMAQAASEMLRHIRGGGSMFEDFSFRGMSQIARNQNDAIADAFYGSGGRMGDRAGLERFLTGQSAPTPLSTSPTRSGGLTVGNLTLQIAGNLDPTNPTAWRQAVENIHAELRSIERSNA